VRHDDPIGDVEVTNALLELWGRPKSGRMVLESSI
jgi:hypothetical protein